MAVQFQAKQFPAALERAKAKLQKAKTWNA
jgi:hypothetical protein